MSNAKIAQMIEGAILKATQDMGRAHATIMHRFNMAFSARMSVLETRIGDLERAISQLNQAGAPTAPPGSQGVPPPDVRDTTQKEITG